MTRLGYLGVGLLYAALAVGGWAGAALAVAGLAALGRAVYAADAGFTLLGPLAWWELVRTGRRRALFLWRTVAVLAVAVTAGVVFNDQTKWWGTFPRIGTGVGHAAFARAAEQTITAVAVGAVYLSFFFCLFNLPGVIPEEREANRLDHLLVTDLRDHEILLGKVAGRLAVLLTYTVAGLPVLAVVTMYGGVSPGLVVFGGLGLVGGVAAFAALGLWVGAGAYRAAGAGGATFGLWIGCVYGLAGLVAFTDWAAWPGAKLSPLARDAAQAAAAVLTVPVPGNPVLLVREVRASAAAGSLEDDAGRLLRQFFAGVLVWVAGLGLLAARRLRRVGMKPPAEKKPGLRGWFAGPPFRPPVTDRPVEWYARWTPGSGPERWLGRLVRGRWAVVGVGVGLLLALWVAGVDRNPGRQLQAIIPAAGAILVFAATLPVGILAAKSLARERERDTLEALLLTGLEPGEIIRQKWRAAVRGADGQLAAAGTAMLVSLLAGGSLVGFVAAAVSAAVNLALAASVGLFCSVHAKTSGRAVGGLLVGSLLWAFGWGVFAGLTARGGSLFLVIAGTAVPAASQSISGAVGVVNGSDVKEFAAVFLLGTIVAAAAAGGFYSAAVDAFTEKVRPTREAVA